MGEEEIWVSAEEGTLYNYRCVVKAVNDVPVQGCVVR